jgi:hypothetical protein
VVPEGTPGSAVPQPPVVAPPADREP